MITDIQRHTGHADIVRELIVMVAIGPPNLANLGASHEIGQLVDVGGAVTPVLQVTEKVRFRIRFDHAGHLDLR
ncbi:hypothetical protein [Streptomyces sp. NPDC058603]|uniref:hypothetical protein n=1 Tax=Streptomyces sp. NPDC058603 TaxID=3346551 RepID=UPI003656D83D